MLEAVLLPNVKRGSRAYIRPFLANSWLRFIEENDVYAQPYECEAKCVCIGMPVSAFVHLCLEPTVLCRWQLFGPSSDTAVSCWLLGAPGWGWTVLACLVGWCKKGNSHFSLPWPVSETQLWWCQAALSTVAGSHILNNRQLQHTALPLSPLILCHALGLCWPGCTTTQL